MIRLTAHKNITADSAAKKGLTFCRKMGISLLPPLLFLDAFLLALAAEYEFMVGVDVMLFL